MCNPGYIIYVDTETSSKKKTLRNKGASFNSIFYPNKKRIEKNNSACKVSLPYNIF